MFVESKWLVLTGIEWVERDEADSRMLVQVRLRTACGIPESTLRSRSVFKAVGIETDRDPELFRSIIFRTTTVSQFQKLKIFELLHLEKLKYFLYLRFTSRVRENRSPRLPPLRTARDTFASSRSSLMLHRTPPA